MNKTEMNADRIATLAIEIKNLRALHPERVVSGSPCIPTLLFHPKETTPFKVWRNSARPRMLPQICLSYKGRVLPELL
jgi:hypothetical protein